MVATDGGIFTFNGPVVGLAPDAASGGYWLVATDGGVFSFGGAAFHGSMGATRLNKPVVGIVAYGDGYLLVASDGGIFDFSSPRSPRNVAKLCSSRLSQLMASR